MTRMGVHKRWHNRFLLNELKCRVPQYADLTPERRAESITAKAEHEDEVSRFADGSPDTEFRDGIHPLEYAARHRLRLTEYEVYAGISSNLDAFHVAAYHWVIQHLLYLGRNIAVLGKSNVRSARLREVSETIAVAHSLGWNEAADRIGAWALQLLPLGLDPRKNDWNPDPRVEKTREPFARFALALHADFAGLALPELPLHPYDTSVYDKLLACWRDPDPQALVEPLLAACDWHTHECMYSRSDRPSKNVDFINDWLMGWPVEVHMVYRVRERLSLALPKELDHPLMRTPFGAYPRPVPMPHDERMAKFMERAFAEIPGLRELVKPAIER